MRYIRKITNIALIFMVISALSSHDIAYARSTSCLRVPMGVGEDRAKSATDTATQAPIDVFIKKVALLVVQLKESIDGATKPIEVEEALIAFEDSRYGAELSLRREFSTMDLTDPVVDVLIENIYEINNFLLSRGYLWHVAQTEFDSLSGQRQHILYSIKKEESRGPDDDPVKVFFVKQITPFDTKFLKYRKPAFPGMQDDYVIVNKDNSANALVVLEKYMEGERKEFPGIEVDEKTVGLSGLLARLLDMVDEGEEITKERLFGMIERGEKVTGNDEGYSDDSERLLNIFVGLLNKGWRDLSPFERVGFMEQNWLNYIVEYKIRNRMWERHGLSKSEDFRLVNILAKLKSLMEAEEPWVLLAEMFRTSFSPDELEKRIHKSLLTRLSGSQNPEDVLVWLENMRDSGTTEDLKNAAEETYNYFDEQWEKSRSSLSKTTRTGL